MKIVVSYFGPCDPALDELLAKKMGYAFISTGYSVPDQKRDLIFETEGHPDAENEGIENEKETLGDDLLDDGSESDEEKKSESPGEEAP